MQFTQHLPNSKPSNVVLVGGVGVFGEFRPIRLCGLKKSRKHAPYGVFSAFIGVLSSANFCQLSPTNNRFTNTIT